MHISDDSYGASASVFIQYSGNIEELGGKISEDLSIPIRFDNREEEPYDLLGYSEVLGFELEIRMSEKLEQWPEFQFKLEIITTESFSEILYKRMFDISHWFARYLALKCELKTMARKVDSEIGVVFVYNRNTWETESTIVEAQK